MKSRVTLSLDAATVSFLTGKAAQMTGGNLSALVDRLAGEAALRESVAAHARHYGPQFFADAEAELLAATEHPLR